MTLQDLISKCEEIKTRWPEFAMSEIVVKIPEDPLRGDYCIMAATFDDATELWTEDTRIGYVDNATEDEIR